MQQTRIFLGAQLRDVTASTNFKKIGAGDDGIIFRVEGETYNDGKPKVLKVFLSEQPSQNGNHEFVNTIRQTQAYNEFKALKIIGSHPNFLTLYSEDVDICDVYFENKKMYPNCWAIQLNYVTGLKDQIDIIKYMGYHWSNTGVHIMNFNYRNVILKFILKQYFDVLLLLQSKGIRHRDLDTVNVKIKLPEFNVYIFDFARADLSHVDGYTDYEDPENIVIMAKTKIKQADQKLKSCRNVEEYITTMQFMRYSKLTFTSFQNPLSKHAEYDITQLDDQMALRLLFRDSFESHVKNDFKWATNKSQTGQIALENNLLGYFIESMWNTPLNIEALNINRQYLSEALSVFSDTVFKTFRHIDSNLSWDEEQHIESYFKRPRSMVHSEEFNAYSQTTRAVRR